MRFIKFYEIAQVALTVLLFSFFFCANCTCASNFFTAFLLQSGNINLSCLLSAKINYHDKKSIKLTNEFKI